MTARRLLASLLSVAAVACSGGAAQLAVSEWLLCEDCSEGELKAATAFGNAVVPALADALKRGPTARELDNIRKQASASYDAILRVASTTPPVGVTRARYVGTAADNFEATYRARAARALGRIGTPAARAVLLDALRHDTAYRADVRRQVGLGLGVTLSIVLGDSQTVFGGTMVGPIRFRATEGGGPAEAVPVRFSVDRGSGILGDTVLVTDATGHVSHTSWRVLGGWSTLRAEAGANTVRAAARGQPPYWATRFAASLAGPHAVPPVPTSASATAVLVLTATAIDYAVTALDVSNVVKVSLYLGLPGDSGPAVLGLCGPRIIAPACAAGPGVIVAGSTSSPIGMTLAQLRSDMRLQHTYVRLVTTSHPTGYLRGQLLSVYP
jgi:hypothetical protein